MKTTKMVFNTPYNYFLSPAFKESGGGTSVTVPDTSPDLSTMVARRDQGLPVSINTNMGYSDDDLPDLHVMDKLEIIQLREDNLQHIVELQNEDHRLAKELDRRTREKLREENEELKRSRSAGTTPPAGGPPEA